MQSAHATTGLNLSKLAFGCAPVMGRIGRAAALKAMEIAFDNGVTHFDVARSYGYGDAEAVLGAFAAGKRDRITIATKFGIRASGTAKGLRWLRPAVRQIASHIPYARSAVRAAAGQTLKAGYYRLADARSSFEESLRQLRSHADMLFIHDCSPDDELSDELLGYLQNLVQAGRIRAWGIATQREWIAPICTKLAIQPMVIQCAQDILHRVPGRGSPDDAKPAIFHSPFGASLDRLQTLFAGSNLPPILSGVSPAFSRKDTGARLLLEGALFMAGDNPVLCSMFDPSHIRDNVDAIVRPRFTTEQLSALIGIATRTESNNAATPR